MYNFIRKLLALYYKIFYKVTIVNKEKIENAKGVVISGNHLSNHDPYYSLHFSIRKFAS